MIPKIFHRIWLDEPIPETFEVYWKGFAELHPEWEFWTWSDSGELGFMRNWREFEAAKTWAGKSDILRYELMREFGGVYVDTDVECLKPFDDLISGRPFVGWENDRLLCPTTLGSPTGHQAFVDLVAALPAWFRKHRLAPPNKQTGPHFLTRHFVGRSDVRFMPREVFYPVGWWERNKLGGPYPAESYCVHHWNQGWDLEGKARIDARQK